MVFFNHPIRLVSSMIMVMLITACARLTKHAPTVLQKNNPVTKVSKAQYKEILALHSEIPDPLLGFVVDSIVLDDTHPNMIEIVYVSRSSTLSQQEIRASYIADMELIGWQLVAEFSGQTRHMIFERPSKSMMCTITLQAQDTIKVTVLQGYKKDL